MGEEATEINVKEATEINVKEATEINVKEATEINVKEATEINVKEATEINVKEATDLHIKETKDKESSLVNLQEMKKTTFPLSRIKKIILEDEDIGKTSGTVPVALSKALELFIEDLVGKLQKHKKIQKENVLEVLKEYKIFEGVDFNALFEECKVKTKKSKKNVTNNVEEDVE